MKVGLVGTGYAARLRADALLAESRAELVAVAGRVLERTQTFGQSYGAIACASWQALVDRPDLDLVIVSTINQDHGAIAHQALQANKHVVVEYPLALDITEAETLLTLAKARNKLLHIEHIELLGGVHQALKSTLSQVEPVFYARYVTLKPERPAPQRWSYTLNQFGFPLVGALSRLHRLVDLFGEVAAVSCQARFADIPFPPSHPHPSSTAADYYSTCLCHAQLHFKSGILAEVTYGKGEALWQAERTFEVQGKQGALIFIGDQGTLMQSAGEQPIPVGPRRGLFAKDTALVLDHLNTGSPLYIQPEASVYTLKVGKAVQQAAETGERVRIA